MKSGGWDVVERPTPAFSESRKSKECEAGPKRVPVLEVRWVRFARQTGFGEGKTAAFEGVETLELG